MEKKGTRRDDFDLLIGASAIFSNMTLVTANIKHFENMPGIKVNTYQYYKKQTFVDMMMGKAHAISNANAAASLGLPEAVIEDMNNFSMTPMYLCK